jgi:kinesin family protein 15
VFCYFCLSESAVVSLLSGHQEFSPKAPKEPCSFINTEKLKAQLLQIQTELNNSKQEYEEFKELTR